MLDFVMNSLSRPKTGMSILRNRSVGGASELPSSCHAPNGYGFPLRSTIYTVVAFRRLLVACAPVLVGPDTHAVGETDEAALCDRAALMLLALCRNSMEDAALVA